MSFVPRICDPAIRVSSAEGCPRPDGEASPQTPAVNSPGDRSHRVRRCRVSLRHSCPRQVPRRPSIRAKPNSGFRCWKGEQRYPPKQRVSPVLRLVFQLVNIMRGLRNDLTKARRFGPSPATTSRASGCSSAKRMKAPSKTSKLFSFDSLPAYSTRAPSGGTPKDTRTASLRLPGWNRELSTPRWNTRTSRMPALIN